MKLFPFIAISALGSALTGGLGHHGLGRVSESTTPQELAPQTMRQAAHRSATMSDSVFSTSAVFRDAQGRAVVADVPDHGIVVSLRGGQVVDGKAECDAQVSIRPLIGEAVRLGVGQTMDMLPEIMALVEPIAGLGMELGALSLEAQQTELSDQERKELEKRIAQLEAKIEKLAAQIEKQVASKARVAPDQAKHFEEMAKAMAEKGVRAGERMSPEQAKEMEALARKMAEHGAQIAQKVSPEHAKEMEALARMMAEQGKGLAKAHDLPQDAKAREQMIAELKEMAKRHVGEAHKVGQEVRERVRVDTQRLHEGIMKEMHLKDGQRVRVLEKGKDGELRGWIREGKDSKMREMSEEELSQWRRRDLGEFTGKGLFGFEDGPQAFRFHTKPDGKHPQAFEFKLDGGGIWKGKAGEFVMPKIQMGDMERHLAPLMKLHELKELPNMPDMKVFAPKAFMGAPGVYEFAQPMAMDKEIVDAIRELREEIAKLRKELAAKGGKSEAPLAPVWHSASVLEPLAGFEGFGKLQKGWRVPTAGSMEGLFESLTMDQLSAHDSRGYLTLDDLSSEQRASLGNLDFLPWELTLTLNGRKLNIRTTSSSRPTEFTR